MVGFKGRKEELMDLAALFYSGNRSWMRDAKCQQPGAPAQEFFFSQKTQAEAKKFCVGCPVLEECLEYALVEVDAGQSDKLLSGVWAGLTGRERAKLRKERLQGTEG